MSAPDLENLSSADIEVLRSLRRILRAVSLHSRQLVRSTGLTVPQTLCLRALAAEEALSATRLAQHLHVSPATVTGLVDRLVEAGLVRRKRSTTDRRIVYILLTEAGRRRLTEIPRPLQDRFVDGLGNLSQDERQQIMDALDRIVDIMGAGDMEVAPILTAEDVVPSRRP